MAIRVLVVDDDLIICKLLNKYLLDLDCVAETAHSAEEGLDLFGQSAFDLVIGDVQLPGMDGLEMVRKMRMADPMIVPIIMTVRQDQNVVMQALEVGAHRFIAKPFDRSCVSEKIKDAIQERQRVIESRLMVGSLMQTRSHLQHAISDQDQRLSHMEIYLQQLLDAAPFAIISTDRGGRILTYNSKAESLYGYSYEEIAGEHITRLMAERRTGTHSEKEVQQDKDGREISVLLSCRDIAGVDGEHIARLYTIEDLREREQLEIQLLSAERLSMLGQMAPRIAHEFKTPLQAIVGYAEIALRQARDCGMDDLVSTLEYITPAGQQINSLVNQMTDLGKPQKVEHTALDIRRIVETVVEPLTNLGMLKHCSVECDMAADVPEVMGEVAQFEQLCRNLIVNAAHAMENVQKRELKLSVQASADQRMVELTVEDSGAGITPENLDNIFEPFFTTKSEGKGTGLGLVIVKTVVNRYKGTIDVDSTLGKGTRFRVGLPAVGV